MRAYRVSIITMKKTIDANRVADELRADEYGGWSYYGAQALAEFLEDLEEDTGEDIELDVVAIRCDFNEYATATEAMRDHTGGDLSDLDIDWSDAEQAENKELIEEAALEWLQDHTTVIPFSEDNPFMHERTSGVIVQAF